MAGPARPRGARNRAGSRSRSRASNGVRPPKIDGNVPHPPLRRDNIRADYFAMIGDAAVVIVHFVDPSGLHFRELSRSCRSAFDLQFQQLSKLISIIAEWQRWSWSSEGFFNGRSPIGIHPVDWRLPNEFKENYINHCKRISATLERDDLVLVGNGSDPGRFSHLFLMAREITHTETSAHIVFVEDRESLDQWLRRCKLEHWHCNGRPTWYTGVHYHTEAYHEMVAKCTYKDYSARCNLCRTACRVLLAEFKFASLILSLHTDDESGAVIDMRALLATPISKPWPRCCSQGTRWLNAR